MLRKNVLTVLVCMLLFTLLSCNSVAPETATPTSAPAAATVETTSADGIERKDTLILDIADGPVADPTNWNPLANWRRDMGLQQLLMEPLFILNYETGQIEPWLGESMTANATLDVWTLKLRAGITWSDGVAFTADDVIFTVKLLLDHAPDLVYSGELATWVDKVEKGDDFTVKFILKKPNPRFQLDHWSVRLWSGVNLVPAHIWQGQDVKTFTNYDPKKGWPVFTGPYKLASVGKTEMVYLRDDHWWGAKSGWRPLPAPQKIIFAAYGDEAKRAELMANNQLDSMFNASLTSLLDMKQRNAKIISHFDDLPYAWVPDPCSRTFEFNTAKAPWDDKRMRWAVNYALDRDEIVAFAYDGTTFPSRHFFPAYPPLNRYVNLLEQDGLYKTYPLLEHNTDKAKALLTEVGWELGQDGFFSKANQPLTLEISARADYIYEQRSAETLVKQLAKVGIRATVRSVAPQIFNDSLGMGEFEAAFGFFTCASVSEPWSSMDIFNTRWLKPVGEMTAQHQNVWRWSGPAADSYSKIVDQIGSLPLDDPKIDPLFIEASKIWLDELPVIPVNQTSFIVPFNRTYWTGWPTAKNNYIHPVTWWQTAHFIIHNLKPATP